MRLKIVLTWKRITGIVAVVIAGALLIGWTGLVPIAGSEGHWPVTRWFLGWTMRNAVTTQALLVEKPDGLDLSDPALIQRSAGNYATSCAGCHGAPGVPQSPITEEMVPSPPLLADVVDNWSDEELFWIVRSGIKFSGMPAWLAQEREDEVWAQVAFLRALPGMAEEDYADLALGGGLADDAIEAGGQTLAALDGIFQNALTNCARCHGRDGLGRGAGEAAGAFPIIAGQPEPYLYATLLAFANGGRESGFMEPPAHRQTPEVLAQLARHYAAEPGLQAIDPVVFDDTLPPETGQDDAGILEGNGDLGYATVPAAAGGGPPSGREGLIELGRRIAVEGQPSRGVPACRNCHGAAERVSNPYYPRLAGQPEWYLSEHLRLWRDGTRGGTAFAHLMVPVARNLTDEQIDAVAAWYAERPIAGGR